MKEAIIVFIAAMFITSFVNGINSTNADKPRMSEPSVTTQTESLNDKDSMIEEPSMNSVRPGTVSGSGAG